MDGQLIRHADGSKRLAEGLDAIGGLNERERSLQMRSALDLFRFSGDGQWPRGSMQRELPRQLADGSRPRGEGDEVHLEV